MGSSKKIVSGVFWSSLVNVVNAIYGFISVPILIAHFGKAEYGLIGLAISVNVYMHLMDMGLNSTNVRFYSTWLAQHDQSRLVRGFQTSLSFYGVIGILNSLLLLIVALFSSHIFNITADQDLILTHLFLILSVSAFCNWFSGCFDQLIKATENVAWINKRSLLSKILMIVSLVATVYLNLSIEVYFLLTCLSSLVIVPLSIGKIRKEVGYISFFPKWDKESFKEILPYSLNIFSFSLFQFSFYNLRPVILGMQGSIDSVAEYRVLNGIINIVTLLGGSFIGVLLPSTAKALANKNLNAFNRIAYDGTKYISILICFCSFGMMSVGPEVITLYVGEQYLHLIPWFNLWLLCTLGTHNQAISSIILSGSDVRAISYVSMFSSIVGLSLSWLLVPYFNIGGVCIAYAVYLTIQLSFYYFYYWPQKMNINSKKVFLSSFSPFVAVGTVIYFFIINLKFDYVFLTFIIKGIVFSVLYIIVVFLILKPQDKTFIVQSIRRK